MPYLPPLLPSIAAASASKFLRLRSRCVRSFSAAAPPSVVREVSAILSHPDWRSRLEYSDMATKIDADLVHSVLLENKQSEHPERLLDFTLAIAPNNLHSLSILAVILCKAKLPGLAKAVIQQLVDSREPAPQVLDSIIKTYRDNCSGGSEIFEILISLYKKRDCLNEACSVFLGVSKEKGLQFPSLAFCNSFLRYLLTVNKVDMFWKVYEAMSVARVGSDVCTTYTYTLCGVPLPDHAAKKINLLDIEKNGFTPNAFSYTALMDGYCKADEVEEALRIKDEMTCRGINPTTITYNVLIDALCRKKDMSMATVLFEEMIASSSSSKDTCPNIDTYHALMKGYCSVSEHEEAIEMKDEMIARGIEMTTVTYNILISVLCSLEYIQEADDLFREMIASKKAYPDNQTYDAMIMGCDEAKWSDKACEVLNEMRNRNSLPTYYTYLRVIKGMCYAGDLQQAESMLEEMISSGLRPNVDIYNCLIEEYLEGCEYEDANRILKSMKERGISPDSHCYDLMFGSRNRE